MKSSLLMLLIILILACATQVSSDIYIPSLLTISKSLSGATFNLAQLSVPIFLFGVSMTQLVAGPISEVFGRKSPMITGLIIMSIGSVLCASANSIWLLIAGRFVQGLGAGVLAALWRAVFRDIMSGEDLAKYGSLISIFMIFVVSVAPALGGYFEQIGWRSSFIFMLGYSLVSLVILQIAYTETGQVGHRDKLKLSHIVSTYKILLSSRFFMGITLCTFLSYGGLFSWIVIAPSLLMDHIGLSSVAFGWVIAISGAAGYSVAALANAYWVKALGMYQMMRIGWSIMIVAGLLLFLGYYLLGLTMWSIIAPILLFYFGSTLIWPNAFAAAFTPFGHIAGYAGSLYGFMQLIGGAAIGSIAAQMPDTDQRLLALIIILTSVISLWVYQVVVKEQKSLEKRS